MSDSQTDSDPQIEFHFIKANSFKVAYADGVFGGVSPKGALRMSFFNERLALPKSVTHKVVQEGDAVRVGEEIVAKRNSLNGVVREVEVDVVMNLESAKAFQLWLGNKIKELESLTSNQPKEN